MGADLMIEPMFSDNQSKHEKAFDEAIRIRNVCTRGTPAYESAQKKVDELYDKMYEVGYFRDSYNDSSLFWKLGLSWWALAADGTKVSLINKQGNISVANAKKLLALVKSLPIQIEEKDIEGWAAGTTVENLKEFFEKKRQRFIAFLELAIANKRPIRASV